MFVPFVLTGWLALCGQSPWHPEPPEYTTNVPHNTQTTHSILKRVPTGRGRLLRCPSVDHLATSLFPVLTSIAGVFDSQTSVGGPPIFQASLIPLQAFGTFCALWQHWPTHSEVGKGSNEESSSKLCQRCRWWRLHLLAFPACLRLRYHGRGAAFPGRGLHQEMILIALISDYSEVQRRRVIRGNADHYIARRRPNSNEFLIGFPTRERGEIDHGTHKLPPGAQAKQPSSDTSA